MNILFYICLCTSIVCAIYQIVKGNKENGLFYFTVFQMYLKKKGLSDEEIEEETYEWARQHNKLFDLIGCKAITEGQYRSKIVEYRKKNGLK